MNNQKGLNETIFLLFRHVFSAMDTHVTLQHIHALQYLSLQKLHKRRNSQE